MIIRTTLLIFVVMSLSPLHACANTPPERHLTKCYMSPENSDKQVCQVSLYAVISNPDRYEGETIRVTGYLRRVYDVIVLYPTRDAYIYSAGQGGIELLAAHPDKIEIMRGKQELLGASTVIGKFSSVARGSLRGSVGVISNDIVVFAEGEPGLPPALP